MDGLVGSVGGKIIYLGVLLCVAAEESHQCSLSGFGVGEVGEVCVSFSRFYSMNCIVHICLFHPSSFVLRFFFPFSFAALFDFRYMQAKELENQKRERERERRERQTSSKA